MNTVTITKQTSSVNVNLDRDIFMRKLIREMAGVLQDKVGMEEAKGYISLVGMEMGKWIEESYKEAWATDVLDRDQIVTTLIDLKRHILGDFYLIEQTSEKIVLGNRKCPFENDVEDRASLCMMTSTVFGGITARNLGYAKVCLRDTIAEGQSQCQVTVYTKDSDEARATEGTEYFKEELSL